MRRTAAATAAVLALVAAPAAQAKEDVTAHLSTRLPTAAKPGSTIRVAWSLYYVENGQKRPFGAGGLFVRLRGRGHATRAYGEGHTGRYVARVKVPRGGIKGIRFGLEGVRMYPDGRTEPAPAYFPLDNDPFAKR